MFKTTNANLNYWKNRNINWADHYWNPEHPHRGLIVKEMSRFTFKSVLEIGCAVGANLYRIHQAYPRCEVGGVDPSHGAIEEAKKRMPYGVFEVGDTDNLFFSTGSLDVAITDACLIYVSPLKIKKTIAEIARVSRKGVVLVELFSKSPLMRLGASWSGYYLHNYPKLLEEAGFYDIKMHKITPDEWPGAPWEPFGYVISAKK